MRLRLLLTLVIGIILREATIGIAPPNILSLMCDLSNFFFSPSIILSILVKFSDGDRAGQPAGGGGGVGERGGAADVLHPARPARRRRRPHPCSVSFPYRITWVKIENLVTNSSPNLVIT